jgi:NADH:ubiquinone oxidoreductase subunit F (NADH-binding)
MFIGAGAYICGEETALIESLEGKEEILVSNHPFLLFQDFGQIQRLSITKQLPLCLDS